MAFEVPLEADRVDDLNLFTAFVRAPVIGTILWILGGDKAKKADDEDKENRLDDDCDPVAANAIHCSSVTMRGELSHRQCGPWKKATPSLIGSEISDTEMLESLDAICLCNETSPAKLFPVWTKKELSWSDEIGKELVDYGGEVSSG